MTSFYSSLTFHLLLGSSSFLYLKWPIPALSRLSSFPSNTACIWRRYFLVYLCISCPLPTRRLAFSFFLFYDGIEIWTQGFVFVKQVLYCLIQCLFFFLSSPPCFSPLLSSSSPLLFFPFLFFVVLGPHTLLLSHIPNSENRKCLLILLTAVSVLLKIVLNT